MALGCWLPSHTALRYPTRSSDRSSYRSSCRSSYRSSLLPARAAVSEAHVHAHQKEILELRARIKTLEEENTKLSSEKMTALVDAAHAKGVVGQLKEQLAQQTKSMETWVRQFQTRCHYDWSDADGSVM